MQKLHRGKLILWNRGRPRPFEIQNNCKADNCAALDDANPVLLRNKVVNYIEREITNKTDAPFTPQDVTNWELLYADKTYNIFTCDGILETRKPSRYEMSIKALLIDANNERWFYNFKQQKLEKRDRYVNNGDGEVTLYEWFNKKLPEVVINKATINNIHNETWRSHRNILTMSAISVIKNMFDAKEKEAKIYVEDWITKRIDPLPIEDKVAITLELNPKLMSNLVSNYRTWRKNNEQKV